MLAVSGGVDSMTLLHLLAQKRQSTVNSQQSTADDCRLTTRDSTSSLELVVAHFNHGIRKDAAADERLVKNRAKELGLPFEVVYGRLGTGASEEAARNARYSFLKAVKAKHKAKAIITAHHQDDLIETALLNVLRGTGRKGLTSLSNRIEVIRPLLDWSKKDIISYAKQKKLLWREDSTNRDTDYLRNYLRHKIIPKLTVQQRQNLICNLDKVAKLNIRIDKGIATLSHYISKNSHIDRQKYAALPTAVSSELLSYWLRGLETVEFDKFTVSRLNLAIRTAKAGTAHPVKQMTELRIGRKSAHLKNRLNKASTGLV